MSNNLINHKKNIITNKCIVCNKDTLFKPDIPFYEYLQCKNCNHAFSLFDKKSCEQNEQKYYNRYIELNKYMIQETPTESYVNSIKESSKKEIDLIKNYLSRSKKILLSNDHLGIKQTILESDGFECYYLDRFKKFNTINLERNKKYLETNISDIQNKKFDTIIVSDSLEFEFCPYSYMLYLLSLISVRGKIILVLPVNNNFVENYKGRSQEFTNTSIGYMVSDICSSELFTIKKDNLHVSVLNY